MKRLGLLLLLAVGCASGQAVPPAYQPTENVLEVVAVLRRHVPDDTYRFAPARDFTDRNVYRSSLLRLENLERVHAPALRAGHLDGVVAFAKGRALERLRAYDLAAGEYRSAAEREPRLKQEALRSAALCERLYEIQGLDLDFEDGDAPLSEAEDVEAVLARFDERTADLEALLVQAEGTHHSSVVQEEIERADVARARYFIGLRQAIPRGDVRAVSELQRLVLSHRDSKNASRHMMSLADLYCDMAAEYVADRPPESLSFDPVRFQELVDSGARLYEVVTNQDGSTEKLEASRSLEACIAFALQVDRDRFTP